MFPNPDQMTYEQLLELGENLGKVSRGLTAKELEVRNKEIKVENPFG